MKVGTWARGACMLVVWAALGAGCIPIKILSPERRVEAQPGPPCECSGRPYDVPRPGPIVAAGTVAGGEVPQ